MGDFMSEQEVIKAVPSKVRSVLDIINNIVQNKCGKIGLLFTSQLIEGNEICVLKIQIDDDCEIVSLDILSEYSYLFFQQLLITLLDIHIESLIGAYYDGLNCYFAILPNDNNNVMVNVQINDSHDLCNLVTYYNERLVFFKANQNNLNGGVFR